MPVPVLPPVPASLPPGTTPSVPYYPLPAGTDRFGQILLAVRAQLMSAFGWGRERVLLIDPARLPFHPHGDGYLCAWPDTELADKGVYLGAGRVDFRMKRRIYVNAFTRTALDWSADRSVWLTDPVLGHGQAEVGIWDSLVEFVPKDGAGVQLSVTALAPVNAGKPRLDKRDKTWGESSLAFEVIYQHELAIPPY